MPGSYLLFSEGQKASTIAILLSGRAEAVQRSGGGTARIAYRSAGDILGELPFVDGLPHFETVTLLAAGPVLLLSHEAFDRSIRGQERIRTALLKVLAQRTRCALTTHSEGEGPALIKVARRLEAIESGLQRGFASQAELADELGLSRASVTRSMTVLRAWEIVRTQRGKVFVVDREKLRVILRSEDHKNAVHGSHEPNDGEDHPPFY